MGIALCATLWQGCFAVQLGAPKTAGEDRAHGDVEQVLDNAKQALEQAKQRLLQAEERHARALEQRDLARERSASRLARMELWNKAREAGQRARTDDVPRTGTNAELLARKGRLVAWSQEMLKLKADARYAASHGRDCCVDLHGLDLALDSLEKRAPTNDPDLVLERLLDVAETLYQEMATCLPSEERAAQ
jgi:hypothetical protein